MDGRLASTQGGASTPRPEATLARQAEAEHAMTAAADTGESASAKRHRKRSARRANKTMQSRWLEAIRPEPMEMDPFFLLYGGRVEPASWLVVHTLEDIPRQARSRLAAST